MPKLTIYVIIVFSVFLTMATTSEVTAQIKLGDNVQNVQSSSILELESIKKGLLLPRVNTAQMKAIAVTAGTAYPTSSNGLVVYNTDSACVCFYNGNVWQSLCSLSANGLNASVINNWLTGSQGILTLQNGLLTDSVVTTLNGTLRKVAVKDIISSIINQSPVRDSIASLIKNDTTIKTTIVQTITDSVTNNRSLGDSVYATVKNRADSLTGNSGLITINEANGIDNTLLAKADLDINTVKLAKDTSFSNTLAKDSSFVTTLVKDTLFSTSLARDSVFTTTLGKDTSFIKSLSGSADSLTARSGLITINTGSGIDSALLAKADLDINTVKLAKDTSFSNTLAHDSSFTTTLAKDTLFNHTLARDSSFVTTLVKDTLFSISLARDSVFTTTLGKDTSFIKSLSGSADSLTARSGLITVNGANGIDSALLAKADLDINTVKLAKDTSFSNTLAHDSSFVTTLVKDTLFSTSLARDSVFTTTLGKDTSFIKSLAGSADSLTARSGLITINTGSGIDSALLAKADLDINTVKLAKDTLFSKTLATDSVFATTLAKDTLFNHTLARDSSFVTTLVKDTLFSTSLARDSVFTTTLGKDTSFIKSLSGSADSLTARSGLITINTGSGIDSALLAKADLDINTVKLAKDTSFSNTLAHDSSFVTTLVKDTLFSTSLARDSVFTTTLGKDTSFIKSLSGSADSLTARSGLITINSTAGIDSALLAKADLDINVVKLAKDTAFSNTLAHDSSFTTTLAKDTLFNHTLARDSSFVTTLVKDTLFSTSLARDSVFTTTLGKDTSFIKSLSGSADSLTARSGLITINTGSGIDSALLAKADLDINVVKLAKDTAFSNTLAHDSSFTTTLAKDTLFNHTLARDSSFATTLVKDSVFTTTLGKDTSFITSLKSSADSLTGRSGLITINTGSGIDSALLAKADLDINVVKLAKDTAFSNTLAHDSSFTTTLAKDTLFNHTLARDSSFVTTLVKDSVFSTSLARDSVFTTTLGKDTSFIKSLSGSADSLTARSGLITINASSGIDSALLAKADLDINVVKLAKDTSFSNTLAHDSSFVTTLAKDTLFSKTLANDSVFATTLAKDTLFNHTLARDSSFVTTLVKDTLFSTSLARDSVFTTTLGKDTSFIKSLSGSADSLTARSGLITINTGSGIDSALLAKADLDINVVKLAKDTSFSNTLAHDSSFTTTLAKDTLFNHTLARDSSFVTTLVKDTLFSTSLARDSVFTTTLGKDTSFITSLKSSADSLTARSGLITINASSGIDSALLAKADLDINTVKLAKDTSFSNTLAHDSSFVTTLVKDTLFSTSLARDSVFTTTLGKDTSFIKSLSGSADSLTARSGLITVNGANGIDSALLAKADLDINTVKLAKDTSFSNTLAHDSSFVTTLAKDTLFNHTLARDSSFVTTLVKDTLFSTSLARDSVFTTTLGKDTSFIKSLSGSADSLTARSGLITVNGANGIDSALLAKADLDINTVKLAKDTSFSNILGNDSTFISTITTNNWFRDSITNLIKDSASLYAANGITKSGDTLLLGGILNMPTTITTSAADYLQLAGLQSGNIAVDSVVTDSAGVIRHISVASLNNNDWHINGNTNGALKTIGTNDAYDLPIVVGGTEAARVLQGTTQANSAGDIVIGTTTAATVASSTSNSTVAQQLARFTVSGGDAFINKLTVGLGGGQIATNSAIGNHALYNNTTGNNNQAVGNQALYNNTSGAGNYASGNHALYANTTGSNNHAIGYDALEYNTTGSNNHAVGYTALFNNTTGNYNQASGYRTLYNNTTGSYNLAVGYSAVYSNSVGNGNTGIGAFSLNKSTGSYNVALGYQAANGQTAGDNNIAIGNNQQLANITGSNQLNIGGAIFGTGLTGSNLAPAGFIGINQTAPTNTLHVTATADPLRLDGLQTGALTDQILTANATGVIRQQTISSVLAGSTSHTLGLSGSTLTSTVNTIAPTIDLSALPIAGDVAGTLAATTVTKINGSPLGTTTGAATGQALSWNGNAWTPATVVTTVTGGIGVTTSPTTHNGDVTVDLDINKLTEKTSQDMTNDYLAVYNSGTTYKQSLSNVLQGLTGSMIYKGTYDAAAATGSPYYPSTSPSTGWTYLVSSSGYVTTASGNVAVTSGDVVVYNGSAWEVSPHTTGVTSFNGRTEAVTASSGDYNASQITNTPAGDITATTVQDAINELDNTKIGTITATTPAAVTTSGTTATVNNTAAYWNANQLQGTVVSPVAPASSQVLLYNGSAWTPTTLTASVLSGSGNVTLGSGLNTTNASNLTGAALKSFDINLLPATTSTLGGVIAGNGLTVDGTGRISNTGVTSITGTTNQVNVSATTGNVILSTPQDIATTSSPIFAGATLSSLQTGASTDQILTVNATGVVRQQTISSVVGYNWSLTGNAGTTLGTNFIGTTDDQDLIFKRNNVQSGWINDALRSTSFGVGALPSSSTGSYNTALGYMALTNNTSGAGNSAFGQGALQANSTGHDNVGFSASALNSNTSGANNVAIGSSALRSNLTGNYNIGIGVESGYSTTTGSDNISIGYYANGSLTTGSNNIAIGSSVNVPNITASNQMNISNAIFGTGMTGTLSSPAGNIGINQPAPTNTLHVTATANPLRLDGLQTGTSTDSVLVTSATSTGVVKKVAAGSVLSNNSLQYTVTATDVTNGYATITASTIADYSATAKIFLTIESDNTQTIVVKKGSKTATTFQVLLGAATAGDIINVFITK